MPSALPALSLAAKLLSRAARSGLTVPLPAAADVGSRLLRLVSEAREAGVDPEQALRDAVREWAEAFRDAERQRG